MPLFRRPGSMLWWMSYNVGGRRYRESTGTENKAKATAALAKVIAEISEGRRFPDKRRSDLTVAGLRDLWLEHAAQKRSLASDRKRFATVVDHFGPRRLVATITHQEIERFRDRLLSTRTRRKKAMAPATVNRHLALLRAAFRLIEGEHHHRNPMRKVSFLAERNKRDRFCSPEEIEELLDGALPALRSAIVLAYEAALRRTEICSLRWADVSLKGRALTVRAEESKNDEPRTVPLTKRALEELKNAPRCLDGAVVDLAPDSLSHLFIDLCKSREIAGLRFHDLRGTAITRLARRGATLAELQKFSGHKSIAALMRYLKTDEDRLRKVVARLDEEDSSRAG